MSRCLSNHSTRCTTNKPDRERSTNCAWHGIKIECWYTPTGDKFFNISCSEKDHWLCYIYILPNESDQCNHLQQILEWKFHAFFFLLTFIAYHSKHEGAFWLTQKSISVYHL